MKTTLVRVLVVFLATIGLISGSAVSASAGTADYQYTCSTPGARDWAMPRGTEFRMCSSGYITERLNGQVKRVIHVNGAGMVFEPTPNRQVISCLMTVVGTAATVILTKGRAAKIGWGTVSAWGLPSCRV